MPGPSPGPKAPTANCTPEDAARRYRPSCRRDRTTMPERFSARSPPVIRRTSRPILLAQYGVPRSSLADLRAPAEMIAHARQRRPGHAQRRGRLGLPDRGDAAPLAAPCRMRSDIAFRCGEKPLLADVEITLRRQSFRE